MSRPNPYITCAACGRDLAPEQELCPACGCEGKNVTLPLTGVEAKASVGQLGCVADEPSTPERPHSIANQTPLGTHSEVQRSEDCNVTIRAWGSPDVGTRGEPQIGQILRERLTKGGFEVEFLPGAVDARGEDGLLILDGRPLVLQVTSVPAKSDFWRAAAQGSAHVSVGAVALLREAVERKSHVDDRASTILAIDARHAGVLADPDVVQLYSNRYPSPTTEFGFAQAWVIGPTASNCARL